MRVHINVSPATHSYDPFNFAQSMSQFFAEVSHVHTHAAVEGRKGAAKDSLGQLFGRYHLTGRPEQQREKP